MLQASLFARGALTPSYYNNILGVMVYVSDQVKSRDLDYIDSGTILRHQEAILVSTIHDNVHIALIVLLSLQANLPVNTQLHSERSQYQLVSHTVLPKIILVGINLAVHLTCTIM